MKKLNSKTVVLNHLLGERKLVRITDIDLINVAPVRHVNGNTKVTIVPTPDSPLTGEYTVVYTRILLTDYLGTDTLVLPPGNYVNTGELLDLINSIYPIKLELTDIVTTRIATGKPSDTVMLQLSTSCPAWLGSIKITFSHPALTIGNIFSDVEIKPIPVLDTNVKLPPGRTTARLLYWSDDFSILGNYFKSLTTDMLVDDEFIDALNTTGDYTWCNKSMLSNYNLRNSKITYIGTTIKCPLAANIQYSHVLMVTIDTKYCNNFGDVLMLHFTA